MFINTDAAKNHGLLGLSVSGWVQDYQSAREQKLETQRLKSAYQILANSGVLAAHELPLHR